MTNNSGHARKTAQIWRAGGMIWLISITLFFSVYDLYVARLPIVSTAIIGGVALVVTIILFTWCLKTLRLAKKLPDETTVDEVKRRKIRKGFFLVLIIEIVAFNIAPFVLLYFGHIEYIAPTAILICAIHFLPLARIFEMPVYYWLGTILSVITILTILAVPPTSQLGGLTAIAAIPSISFILLNWITITYVLTDARKYLGISPKSKRKKPNYGIDNPKLGIFIALLVGAIIVAAFVLKMTNNQVAKAISGTLFSIVPTGIVLLLLMVLYVTVEKFRHRDRMLDMLSWNGSERVLDIGTGKGLLMIGAAKRLTNGKSFGIDIWNQQDLSGNSYEAAMQNAEFEGVQHKVELENADAQDIPFPDNSFDYVLSNLCLHNINSKQGRAIACKEIMRVLKPGGTALVSDFMHTRDYQDEFRKYGKSTNRTFSFLVAPVLLHIVSVVKN